MVSEPEDDAKGESGETEVADGRAARAERRRTQRREAIVAAAKSVFRDKGYHQASVHDIIDEARIARGTFYLYFSSKQEVFGHLVEEFLQLTRGQVRRISLEPDALPPVEQLRNNFRRVVSTVLANDDVASVILRDPTSFDDESRRQINHFFDQVLGMIEDAVRVGQTIGLVGQCDVHVAAAIALGGTRAAVVRMLTANAAQQRTTPAAPRDHQRDVAFANPEHVADELLAFFLRGLSDGTVST